MVDQDNIFAYRNQTKLLIFHVYQKLLDQKRFEDISVSDIVKACGISRTTFYNYFQDKYDLFFQWIWELSREFIDSAENYRSAILQNLEYGYQNQKFLRRIIADNGDLLFTARYMQYSRDFNIRLLKDISGSNELTYEQLTAISFFSAGFIQLWTEWIQGGCKQPPEVIVDRVLACIPSELAKFEYFR